MPDAPSGPNQPGLPADSNIPALLDAAPDALVIVGTDGCIQLVNSQTERLFGYERSELVGKEVEVLIPQRYRSQHPLHRGNYFAAPKPRPMGAGLELHGLRRDGSEFPAEVSLAQVETAQGSVAMAAIRDVTVRKKAEQKFRALLEAAPDAIVIVDRAGRIVLANTQTERLFQYPKEDLLGEPVEILVPRRFREIHGSHRGNYSEAPKARAMGSDLELWGLRRDGTEFPVEISLSPLETEEGILISSAIRDVTERKAAEKARSQLAAIVDSSHDAVIGNTLEGIIESWNHGATLVFGYERDEVVGSPISVLYPPGLHGEEAAIIEKLKSGERVGTFETVRRHKKGHDIDVSVTISPIRDSRGRLVGASKTARNISDRKRAEKEVARAIDAIQAANRDLEAFSYSVAHDLRAPLRGIDGFSQTLLSEYADQLDENGRRYLRRVRESAHRMAALIDDLLSLAHVSQKGLRLEQVDLTQIARNVAQGLRSTQPDRTVNFLIQDGLTTSGDKRLLAVALENLFGNSWKFTQGIADARIEFGLDDGHRQPTFFVRDNGVGFDMAYAAKLFGVFQRLHSEREFEGTGIGLATVQRIIERHGGKIWAHGEVSVGACFYFTLSSQEDE